MLFKETLTHVWSILGKKKQHIHTHTKKKENVGLMSKNRSENRPLFGKYHFLSIIHGFKQFLTNMACSNLVILQGGVQSFSFFTKSFFIPERAIRHMWTCPCIESLTTVEYLGE